MTNELKYTFSKRSKKKSFDPYDCLAHNSPRDHPLITDGYTIWTNDTTAILSEMPKPITDNSSQYHQTPSSILQSTSNMQMTETGSLETTQAVRATHVKNEKIASERKNMIEIRNSILAGSVAGMASCTIFHPFDVLRTKMQASTKLKSAGTAAATATSASRQAGATLLSAATSPKNVINSSSGPLAVFSHTIKNGGIRAFYTGFSFPLAAQAAYKATIFTTNRLTQNAIIDFKTKEQRKTGVFTTYRLTFWDHFLCGSVSGAVNALLFVSPVEYIRSQLIAQHTNIAQGKQLKNGIMNGPFDVIRTTLKSNGIRGLWTGIEVTLVRDSIGVGVFFLMYEVGKARLPSILGTERDSKTTSIVSGMLSGFGYWFSTLPLDSLKTLVQTGKTTSAKDTLSLLVQRDGFLGAYSQLFRGWQLAFGRGIPSAAVTLTTYSVVYNMCNDHLS